MKKLRPKFVITTFLFRVATALSLSVVLPVQAAEPRMSGIYLTAADYKEGRLAFEGDCKSKAHGLELHDILNKPYVDVTHESQKRRYSKSDLFGFRACDGRDYRFSAKLEYQILEARELYVYSRETYIPHGRASTLVVDYFFSLGGEGPILSLTRGNLKQALPDNHRFHDMLDSNFSAGQKLEEYDEFHKMFKVNRLLIASKESEP